MSEQLTQMEAIITSLLELNEDSSVPKNVRIQIQGMITILREDMEIPIKINKTLNQLDEISSDVNIQSYTRTQIWNIMSLLEKL